MMTHVAPRAGVARRDGKSSCSNCDVIAKKRGAPTKTAAFVTLLISGCFPAPAYGAPCTARQLDGRRERLVRRPAAPGTPFDAPDVRAPGRLAVRKVTS